MHASGLRPLALQAADTLGESFQPTVGDPLEALIVLGVGYIVLSVAGSALVEIAFQLARVRGRIMANAIRTLLGPGTEYFYRLPTIRALRQVGFTWPTATAQYSARGEARLRRRMTASLSSIRASIPGATDSVDDRFGERADPVSVDFIDSTTFALAFATLAAQGGALPEDLTDPESPFTHRGGEVQMDRLRHWFDQAMLGSKRQYRRSVQLALFGLGLLGAAMVDLDSVAILRQGFLGEPGEGSQVILFLGFDILSALSPWFGYVVTAGAVALGAQYWFDVVGRLVGLRSQVIAQGIGGWGRPARRPGAGAP